MDQNNLCSRNGISHADASATFVNTDIGGVENVSVISAIQPECVGNSCQKPITIVADAEKCMLQQNIGMQDERRQLPSKSETKADNWRPLGKMLHDLGLELVREQVYRDLIEIQTAKDAKNKLEEREKSQLVKLVEAHARLVARNAPYRLQITHCCRCNFLTSSLNAMVLHRQFGSFSQWDPTLHVCCECEEGRGFSTRSASSFIAHMSEDHKIMGRLLKKPANFACTNCPYEHRNSARMQTHMAKCLKKYPVICNLQPLPGDCDIALVYRTGDGGRHTPPSVSRLWSINSSSNVGQPSVRALLNSIRSQSVTSLPVDMNSSTKVNVPLCSDLSLVCEICGRVVESREALWSHFRIAHHVDLSRATVRDQEPWMKCDVCSGRFWTYQGLSRHLLIAHNRAVAASYSGCSLSTAGSSSGARCYLCGASQSTNPLSHFSAYHNITLLEMYHARLCGLCNRKMNSGRAFEEHMVEQHSDIFANFDVLRTVLQALTAARYFKNDDARRTSSVQQVLTQSCNNSKPIASASKHSSSISTDNEANSSRLFKRKVDGETNQPLSAIKSFEMATTAEEVKKLHDDFVNIGRPTQGSLLQQANDNTTSSVELEVARPLASVQPTSDEIPPKKACLCDDSMKLDAASPADLT